MRVLVRFVCIAAMGCYGWTGLAAELEGARLSPPESHFAPLAVIQAKALLRGLRVRTIRWDAVLRQSWVVLEDVDHPERPLWAELTDPVEPLTDALSKQGDPQPESPPAYTPPKPVIAVVHYGDRVRLWRIERNVRMEMSAVTQASAAVGDEVKLKIIGSGADGDAGWQVTGIVRGPGDVEME